MATKTWPVPITQAYWFDPDEIDIMEDEDHFLFDPRVRLPVSESLVKNIMYNSQGVLEPVIVTKDGDRPVVVDGRQRVRAAREANRILREQGNEPIKVPCILRRGSEEDLVGVGLSANEHTQGDDLLTKADKLNRYLNTGGTEAQAADIFGVSRTAITNWKKILDLSGAVRTAIRDGKIAASAGAALSSLPRVEQKEKLDEMLVTGAKTTTQAKKAAKGAAPKKVAKLRGRKEIERVLNNYGKTFEKISGTQVLKWVLRQIELEDLIEDEE